MELDSITQSHLGSSRRPRLSGLSPESCSSLAAVGCARSAPLVCLPGRGELCTGRCRLLINDDANGSCATGSLSSPLWLHPVHSEVKSRPAGLDFSVEGLLCVCVSFLIQEEGCALIHRDLISKYREQMLNEKGLLSRLINESLFIYLIIHF